MLQLLVRQSSAISWAMNHQASGQNSKNAWIASTIQRCCSGSAASLRQTRDLAAAFSFAQKTSISGACAVVLQEATAEAGKQEVRVCSSWPMSFEGTSYEYCTIMQCSLSESTLAYEPPINYYQLRQRPACFAIYSQYICEGKASCFAAFANSSLCQLQPSLIAAFANCSHNSMLLPSSNLLQLSLLALLLLPLYSHLLLARLLTIDDAFKLGYKAKFKFTDVLASSKTRSFIKNHPPFASADQIPNVPATQLGRIEKSFHAYPTGIDVYAASYIFDRKEAYAEISVGKRMHEASKQMLILHESSKAVLGELQGNNVCWVENKERASLSDLSYQATHELIGKCLQQLQISLKGQNPSATPLQEQTQPKSLLELSLVIALACLAVCGFTAAKLWLIHGKNKSSSVV